MSNVQEFPATVRMPTAYEALIAAAPSALDAIPGAVYLCDRDGWLVRYNSEAAELWGRSPNLDERTDRFCGSYRLFLPDGTPLPHDDCPAAVAVREGAAFRNDEIIIERPDGTRVVALVNIRPLRDHRGGIQGVINCLQDITGRKELEEEARRKSGDLDDFFENNAVALHIVSAEGIILRANKVELALLGYTADEYIGRHIAEFHADAPVIGEMLHRLSSGSELDRFPARLRTKDGSLRHVVITSNSRFDNGKFVNTRCSTTDVTDLYEAEIARRDSEERLTATYEAATVGIAEADESGRLLRVNDALCKILGRSREQLLGTSFVEYTDEADREEDARLYARQISGEIENYSIRKRSTRPDGSLLHLDIFSSSVRDESGRFRYGVRVTQDVTGAKRLEDQIRESERHMRELLEALPAAFYTTDAEGRITFYNKAAVELAGRTPQLGDQWCVTWRLYLPDGTPLPHDQCPHAIALRENRPIRGLEAVAERPDGTRVPFLPYPTPLRDVDGNVIGAINMLVDITERKQAENRQKILIDELNHRVKNTLATVQSLATQSARHVNDVEQFISNFEARLISFSRVHDLLTKQHWEHAPVDTLVREVIAPLAADAADRIRIGGPSVELDPRAAVSISMALNELSTNAAKYGALCTSEGSLTIGWNVRDERASRVLDLTWRERGGPPVIPPKRRGFGSRLMERCIERDLDGEFDLVFDPDGVRCRMSIPLASQARA